MKAKDGETNDIEQSNYDNIQSEYFQSRHFDIS